MKSCRLCKSDYEEVKQRLSMRQVAAYYGFREDRKHLCLCPFHADRHPSMRIYPNDKGFYCFSCGKGGDVITFVSALYGLSNEQACKKLIEDFSLPIKTEFDTYREKREREKKIKQQRELDHFRKYADVTLRMYWILLCEASRDPEDPHFEEAMQEMTITEYRLQCLRDDPAEYYADRKAVKKIGEIRDRFDRWYRSDDDQRSFSGRTILPDLRNQRQH